MPDTKCITSAQLDALRKEIKKDIEKLTKDQNIVNDKLSNKITQLELNEAVRNNTLASMQETMAEMRDDVKTLLEKPGKRYESLGNEVIKWAIIGLLTASQIFGG